MANAKPIRPFDLRQIRGPIAQVDTAVVFDRTSPRGDASMRSRLKLLAFLLTLALPARADVLNIGTISDPALLDPARGGNYADRNVLAAICDKLIDTDPDMHFVPQLEFPSPHPHPSSSAAVASRR
jgi:hypothetical protein